MKWQYRTNANGLPVTEIEPIPDKTDRTAIKKLLRESEPQAAGASEIYFW
jgi:hypothetical protein